MISIKTREKAAFSLISQITLWLYVTGGLLTIPRIIDLLGRGVLPSTFQESTDLVWTFFRVGAFALVAISVALRLYKSAAQMLVALTVIRWFVLPPIYAMGGVNDPWGIPFSGFSTYSQYFATEFAMSAAGSLLRDLSAFPLLALGIWSLVALITRRFTDEKREVRAQQEEVVI